MTPQIKRFLVVGGITVAIDYAVYTTLLWLGLTHNPAKAAGFIAGAIFAYVANRLFTFKGNTLAGTFSAEALKSYAAFTALYLSTLAINVASNALFLWLGDVIRPYIWPSCPQGLIVFGAFGGATVISAALNFVGMKFFVFKVMHHG